MPLTIDQDPQIVKNCSRVETNLKRLLKKCEEMAQQLHKDDTNNWRLEKYTSAVENMIVELRTGPNQPSRDQMLEYERRNEFIKGLIYTTKLGSTSERAMASQLIKPSVSSAVLQEQMEIKHRNASKYSEDLRKELLGSDEDETDEGPHRQPQQQVKNVNKKEELDDLLKYHHAMQEKIADQMLDLTRSLKDQVSFAGQIVKKDTEILEKSSNTIDQNQGNLKIESTKLETFNKRACKCWVWFLIVLVFSVFISMVLFMRLFRKNVAVVV